MRGPLSTSLTAGALVVGALIAGGVGVVPASAQELEPRAFRALPVGLNFFVIVYSFSSGNVLVDPTAPVEGLDLDIGTLSPAYVRSFSFFGRSATIGVVQPYVLASGEGTVNGELRKGSRNAPGDGRIRLTTNLVGGPAMTPAEFAQAPPRRTFGVSLTVALPTGQYNSKKIVNFGANRWGFKPELGYSGQRGPWITDVSVGAWLFTKNTDGPGGAVKRQDPIGSFQFHFSHNWKNGVWLALDANYFKGGRTSVGGDRMRDLQANSRFGLTLSVPLGRRDSLKVIASTGAYTRAGADFDVGAVAYQTRWGGSKTAGPSALEETAGSNEQKPF